MAEGAVTVKAALYYRSCSEEIAEGAGVEVPTTTMAEVTKTVFSSAEAMESGEPEPGDQAGEPEETDTPAIGTVELLLIALGVLAVAAVAFVIVKRRTAK